MNDKIFQQSDFTLASVYGMVILDIFLYSFITWYLDQVLPTQYGQRQHPLFFLHKPYWFPDAAVPGQLSQKGSTKSNDRFEPSAEGKENAVEIDDIHKSFGEFTAVNNGINHSFVKVHCPAAPWKLHRRCFL
ncbi:hypothetical protein CYMTET_39750 [Cymbomonas tetramitiformis]|uniref:Uncharacterized protein n=2 Tax=Cymbomonas tetramitiformis TaxID=36881 RepID=A0AAE0CAN1_9CHLO|nr:hypothetical protein CYMTET_39750 [Cymbomonas tetramitiformis]